MTSPAKTLREHIARAFVRNRIVDNMERWGRARGEDFIQQAVDYAWTDFLRDAEIALAAIEASGTHVVVPVEQYERTRDALEQIVGWSKAYPLDIFPEPDMKKARDLLEAGGITLDAVSAHCMRHVIDGVGKIAREAARTGPWGEEMPGPAINLAVQLAVQAEKVCGTYAGDKSVDGLRAALSAFGDAYDAWIHRTGDGTP